MPHFTNDHEQIPLENWEYYFAVEGDAPVVIDHDSNNNDITMEDLYQIFKARFLAEQKGEIK